MSSKKQNSLMESNNRNKNTQSGTQNNNSRNKNRRRSARNANLSNGENGDSDAKVNSIKRNKDSVTTKMEEQQEDLYKDIIDLVPSAELDCCPTEVPAPPGTRVNLHGVILHETEGGLIVLNVRWRNKIYSGALIDVDKSKWATDNRDNECNGDSKEFQTPPPIKKLKIPTSSANQALNDNEYGNNKKKVASPTAPSKAAKARNNCKKRNLQDRAPSPLSSVEESIPLKKNKVKVGNQNGSTSPTPVNQINNSDNQLECPEPNCGKKYKTKNSLTYHIRRNHQKSDSQDDSGKENKSESHDDSDSGDDNFIIDEQIDEDSKNEMLEDKTSEEQVVSSQSEEDSNEKLKTENEKQIEKLKKEAEKNLAALMLFKTEQNEDENNTKEEEKMEVDSDVKENIPAGKIIKEEPMIVEKTESTEETTDERKASTDSTIDVESTKASQPEDESKNIIPSTQGSEAPPLEQIQPVNSNTVKKEEDSYPPRGSSKTIFHQQDPVKSLTELFAPANHSFHQFSPTLANLNPQKINESLTDALSKQQEVKPVNAFKTTNKSELEIMKKPLTPKPSIEIKPLATVSSVQSDQDKKLFGNPNDLVKQLDLSNPILLSKPSETVPDSDTEESDLPDEILGGCSKVYPQNDHDVKPAPGFSSEFIHPMSLTYPLNFEKKINFDKLTKDGPNLIPNKLPQNNLPLGGPHKNIYQELFLSNMANIESKSIPAELLAFMNHSNNRSKEEGKLITGGINTSIFPLSDGQLKPNPMTPMLQQRILGETMSSNAPSPTAPKMIPLNSAGANLQYTRQLSKEDLMPNNELKVATDKVNAANVLSARDRNFEKQKLSPASFRINPPSKITGNTWVPEISKDSFNGGPVSSSFRVPSSKSLTVPGNHAALLNEQRKLNNLKPVERPSQPIPIAPAPSPVSSMMRGEFGPPSSEYNTPPEVGEKDGSLFSTFTLTSDKRLISSTPDNRGRPRKTRGKIPLGPHPDLGKVPGMGEMTLSRKTSASPVVRASVIQGSTHPTLEGPNSSKSPERMSAEAHAMLGRTFENMDERFAAHPQSKISSEIRNAAEKYKALSSPPGMFYNPSQPRNMLSPQNPRSASRSPNIKSDLFRDSAFQQRALEHIRSKSDLLCAPSEPMLMPDVNPKHSLSPHEAMQMMNAYAKREFEKERFAAEYHNSQGRFQHQRQEMQSHHQEMSNAVLERRYAPGEKEHHARLMAAERERLLHQSALPLGGFRRSNSPPNIPPSSEAAGGHHNLFLERRDGAFLGPLSSFQQRPNEPHKR